MILLLALSCATLHPNPALPPELALAEAVGAPLYADWRADGPCVAVWGPGRGWRFPVVVRCGGRWARVGNVDELVNLLMEANDGKR